MTDFSFDSAVHALQECIKQPTISGSSVQVFRRMHTLLRTLFPRVFTASSCETLGGALLICLPGRQGGKPMVFLSHLDVVSPGDESNWTHPPFGGEVHGSFIYGRGAADMKGHMVALLSACEMLLQEGWQPGGDVWFAFSCDEETRGGSMAAMAQLLRDRGVQPAFVLDEGGSIARPFALTREPFALVGVCEKGRLLFSLSCTEPNAMEILARAAARISHIRLRPRLCEPVLQQMLPAMKPLLSRSGRFCLRHHKIMHKRLLFDFSRTPMGRAVTTTQLSLWKQSGDALLREIPTLHYSASVLPGDSTEELLTRVRRIIAKKPITLTLGFMEEPGALSPAEGLAWDALVTAIQVHFPGKQVVPSLLAGGTDARRMESLCPQVYRFSPFILPPEEMRRMHGANERLSLDNLRLGMAFFRQMLQA